MENMGLDIAGLLSPPDILKCTRVLCIQPHPDDNEIGMGGIIAKLAKNGCEIHYLTVTNGDMGNKDPNATPAETAAIRRKETEAAGRHLGAVQFHYLDHGDGTLQDVLGKPGFILREEVITAARYCTGRAVPHILRGHTHTVNQCIIKMGSH